MLKLNNYTRILFKERFPVTVIWSMSELREWPTNEELIEQLISALSLCGWQVKVKKYCLCKRWPIFRFVRNN